MGVSGKKLKTGIDDLLRILSVKKIKRIAGPQKATPRFSGVFDLTQTAAINDELRFFTDATPDCIDSTLDSAYLTKHQSMDIYEICKVRELAGKEKHQFRRFPFIYEKTFARIIETTAVVDVQYYGGNWKSGSFDGEMIANEYVTYRNGSIWRGQTTKRHREELFEDFASSVGLYYGLEFTKMYYWGVNISLDTALPISIYLMQNHFDIRTMFANREKEMLTSRRRALLHLVNNHTRMIRGRNSFDNYTLVNVRDYLRGVKRFLWCGLNVSIKPSRDVEKKTAINS